MKGNLDLLVPVLVTGSVIVVSMLFAGISPFGDHVLLFDDAAIQYVGFFGWFSNVLHGEADLFYSFSKALGGGTLSLYAYYLASPLNLLAFFFTPETMPLFFSILIPLKLILASLMCYIYLRFRFQRKGVPFALIASAYALAACNLDAGACVMWLDGLVMLPIVCMGVRKLVLRGESFALVVAVFVTVLSNWYAGYMVCLASVLCFFGEIVVASVRGKDFVRCGLRYAGSMLIGIGLSMPLFLPVILETFSSSGTASSGFMFTLKNYPIYPDGFSEALQSLFMGANASPYFTQWGMRPANFPVSGILIVLVLLFFMLKNDSANTRKKVVYAVILAILVTSIFFKPLDMVWTGFTRSDSYNPRYMFIVVFCLAVVAADAVSTVKTMRDGRAVRNGLLKTFAILTLVTAALILDGWRPSFKLILLQFVLVSGTTFCIVRWVRARAGKVRFFAAAVMVCLFCVEGLYIQTNQMKQHFGGTSFSAYSEYMREASEVLPSAAQVGFYRGESTLSDSRGHLLDMYSLVPTSEYMALGVSSLSHYSSAGDQSVNDLLGNLGYCLTPGHRAITYYNSPLYLTDSLFGVKRVLSERAPYGYEEEGSFDVADPTGVVGRVFSNDDALSVGFGVDSSASSFLWGDDCFENQSMFVGSLLGRSEGFYREAHVAEASVRSSEEGWCFEVAAEQSGPLYILVSATRIVDILCEGEFVQTAGSWEFDTNAIYLGYCDAGESVEVEIRPVNPGAGGDVSVKAATLDEGLAQEALETLSRNQLDVSVFEDGRIEGAFKAEDGQCLLLTVPYEEEWSATVDGEPVEIKEFQGLMLVSLDEGDHWVSLTYGVPQGMTEGAVLALLSLLALCTWRMLERRHVRYLRA